MIHYPEVMRRAQAQIDEVVGRDRLPSFSDREQLPYIEAMVKEVLRWRPVGPIGLPRQTAEDDYYNGYFIPKGTLILLNVWAMNRDPTYFPDYDDFRPERYLDDSGALVCVGKDISNQALFINIAALLWAFDFQPTVGEDEKPDIPSKTNCVDEGLVV
ncbi:hypothetical protein EIP86_001507 [Pleurotus ostreatoroseus]|nr:hypothetical protein EIP86_001507 [Pleurotus ostreatoroseus]